MFKSSESTSADASKIDPRVGWRVVLVSTIALFIIFGIRLSFAVFFAEFTSANGWSNEAAAGIFSMSMLAFALGSAPAGMLLDRYGPRIVFTTGALMLALGLGLSSRANSVLHLMLTYGLLGGLALAIIGLGPVSAVIAGWFPTRRGVAIGTAFAGTGFGSLLFVPLVERLIAWFGWRDAYLALALICLLVLAPLLAFGQRRPPRNVLKLSFPTPTNPHYLLRQPAFWWLLLLSFTAVGPLRSLSVHQIAYMEGVGIDRAEAARFVGIAGFLTAWAFIGWGYISDRIGRPAVFTLGALSLIAALGALLLMNKTQSILLLGGYSVLLAMGEGTRSSQTTALASDTFQGDNLGFVNGMVGALFGLGAAFSPWLVGRLRDSSDSYTPGLQLVFVLTLVSIAAFFMVGRARRGT